MESTTREIIYEGSSTNSIESLPDYPHPVVIKKPSKHHLSRQTSLSLEKEFEMTRSLDTVEGVRKVFEQRSIENQPALILEYIDGKTLRDHITSETHNLRSKLEIANDLALILAGIHKQNVLHLDLNSENILIGSKQQSVHIIDLGSASHIDRTGQLKVHPDHVLGTLPYISPEQTGRINRALDERSDLYSLGIVLYELLTGQLPFDSSDPLELVHQHIAMAPTSPSDLVPEIPAIISAIILKLLSKDAEDRYQSAAGVQVDLEKCLQRLNPNDAVEAFSVGEADLASRLRFPQELYGRDRELEELESAFESVSQGTPSIVFVGGYSGIGKTALVEEMQRPVSEKSGYFIEGKFDQLATTPYAGIGQALTRFVSQILTQTEAQLAAWRSKILEAVGPNGRVLTDVVPSLELIIGPQPAVLDLSGPEAQNRFNYVFQRFFGAIARSEHPICFFLDDLQWIDPGSLDLLKNLFSSLDLAHLLLVGAYRDNEVHESHPLMALIADLEKAGANLKRMTLQDLAEAHVETLVSDTLQSNQDETRELTSLVYSQTDGNPFFTRQVLRSMEDQDLIAVDTATGRWRWDMGALRNLDATNSVVELLVSRLKELPADIQESLKVAACIGSQFDSATLATVTAGDDDAILDHVQEAVAAGLIWERDDLCYFVHDRVQEAAYALVLPEERDHTHLAIGRLLLAEVDDTDLEERIFDIATHYNLGANLLADPAEKLVLVRLNLVAGRKARMSAAFAASADYLKQGIVLLGEGTWRDHYQLTLDVHNTLIEVYYLNIQYEEVEALFDVINDNVERDLDAGFAHKTLIMSCAARHELVSAISLAESYLERLGVTLDSERESNLPVADLYELPQMEDEEKLAAMEVLMAITTPMIFSAHERLPSVIYTMLNLVSRYGNNAVSGFAYSWYATNLCLMQQYQEGSHFGLLAVDLLAKYPHAGRAAEIMNMQHAWIRHWGQSVHDQIAPLNTHHQLAMQSGDFEWALYCLLNYTLLIWGSGKPLDYYLAKVEPSIALCQSKNQQFSLQSFLMFAQSALNLTGRSSNSTQLEGNWFSEETMMPQLEGNHMLLALYGLLKIKLCYLFGDPGAAYRQIQDVLKYRGSLNPHYLYTKISFFGALSCIAGLRDGESDADHQERNERLATFENELNLWADVAPMNYQHQYDLVIAEKCRISDKQWEAIQLYEQAIQGARENQFVHDQALANELFAQFWLEQGNDKIAQMYIREAHANYHQWGARAKVDHLEQRYPQWFPRKTILPAEPESPDSAGEFHTTIIQPTTPLQLDLESIINASQMLSAETDLEELLKQMMALVMANSGAEKATLLLKQEDGWFVQARSDITADKHDILLNQPFDPADSEFGSDSIPESVFNYCHRSKEVLVVGDAQVDPRFAEDRMIRSHGAKSMACVPVVSQGRLRAMLYLENHQMRDVFTIERVEILKHLSTQFGVSVENALLYERLAHKVNELRTSESRFRTVVENANETIVVTQDERIQFSNDQIGELSGYSPVEVRSMSFDEFIHPEDLEKVLGEYESRLSGEKPQSNYSVRIITKTGQLKHVFVNSVVVDWNGRLATLAMISNITELKLAEEGLIKSEERFRSLMEQSPFPMELLTPDGILSQVNPSWYQLWGVDEVSAAEVIEKYNMITDPQLTKLGIAELVKKAFSGEHIILPPIIYDADLTVTDFELENLEGLKSPWIQCHLYPIKDANGELEFVVNTYVDITDLRQAEQDIRESEKRFRSIMESSPLDIVIMTPDGKISQVNAAWKRSWGLSEEETVQVLANYNMRTDEQIKSLGLAPLVEKAFKGENVILPPMDYEGNRAMDELELEGIEAQARWIQTHMYSVKDANGQIDYVVAINMDLTKLKLAEREAQVQREALARVDRTSSMGQLTGSISHELNQPLTGILSNAQAAEMMLESGQWEKEEISEIMADIVADAKRAGDVIRNLRQLYREQRVEFLPIDINVIVEETTKLLHSEFLIQRVLLTTQLDSTLPWVNGNRIQLQQVLLNLVMNASQAMNDKAGEDRRIHITTAYETGEVKVCVEDNGSGIDPNVVDDIFEPLATWKPGHTGMGLAISNSIVTAHGGRMWAENKPEGGARVGFAVPIIREGRQE